MILVLIIMKLALLSVVIELEHIFTYKKIFINEQELYHNQLNLDKKIAEIINVRPLNILPVGFMPDDLSFLCPNGINIYPINIDGKLYGYFGMRSVQFNNITLIQQKNFYYKIFLENQENKNRQPHKLKVIDLFGNHQVEQVFFFDNNNFLWRYDILQDQFFLENSNANNIDYIISPDVFNIPARKYVIYLHTRDTDQDIIKINNITIIKSQQKIKKFFLRGNYIIILYQNLDLEPHIYKICHKMSAKKIAIKLNVYKQSDVSTYELLWDDKLNVHKIMHYTFNLPNDRNILSFQTSNFL